MFEVADKSLFSRIDNFLIHVNGETESATDYDASAVDFIICTREIAEDLSGNLVFEDFEILDWLF